MAVIASTATGNWSAGATWVGGVAPGSSDTGKIMPTHVVTYDAAAAVCEGFTIAGGELVLDKDFVFEDIASAVMEFEDDATGVITTNATKTTPRIFKSENTNPTNKWTIDMEDIVGKDARDLDFSYCEFQGNYFYLGNNDAFILFNTGDLEDPLISRVIPATRDIQNTEHDILGRPKGGRVYPERVSARVIVVSGRAEIDNYIQDQIEAIIATKKRIALFTDRSHFAKAWIDRYRVDAAKGRYNLFSIIVREDSNE